MYIIDKVLLLGGKNTATTTMQYRCTTGTWGTAATSGIVSNLENWDNITMSFRIATMTSTKVAYRAECRFTDRRVTSASGEWAVCGSDVIATTTTINELVDFSYPIEELRVGWRVVGAPTATAENIIYADLNCADNQ
jgi:hypothetical protein